MIRNNIEHIKELIEEIDILIELLDIPIEEDPIREEDTTLKSILKNKEYKEDIVYNSKATFERGQKDFILVGEDHYQSTSDNMLYVNHRWIICESGGPVGNECEIEGSGVKVLRASSKVGKDIVLEFKKSKKIKKDFEDKLGINKKYMKQVEKEIEKFNAFIEGYIKYLREA